MTPRNRIQEAVVQSTLEPEPRLYLMALSMTVGADMISTAREADMAQATGLHPRKVRRIRATLARAGILESTQRGRAGTLTTVLLDGLKNQPTDASALSSFPENEDTRCPHSRKNEDTRDLISPPLQTGGPPPDPGDTKPRFQAKNGDFDESAQNPRPPYIYISSILEEKKTLRVSSSSLVNRGHPPLSASDLLDDPNTRTTRTDLIAGLLREDTGRSGSGVVGAIASIADEVGAFPREFAGGALDEDKLIRAAFEVSRSLRGPRTGPAGVGEVRGRVVGILRAARRDGEYPAVWGQQVDTRPAWKREKDAKWAAALAGLRKVRGE